MSIADGKLDVAASSAMWEKALLDLERAGQALAIDDEAIEMVRRPRRSVEISVPVRMDDATVRTFVGYRVQHSLTRGPGKGGVRFDPFVGMDDVKAMAMAMTWKCAIARLPYGGAKGAVRCEAAALSTGERERITRRYAAELAPIMGPGRDIPAPDLGTGEQEMAWMMDTYVAATGRSDWGAVSGKPVLIGGNLGRRIATGFGVFVALDAAAQAAGYAPPIEVAVSGFGEVGRAVAEEVASDPRYRLVAIGDVTGAVHRPAGIALEELTALGTEPGAMQELAGVDHLDRDELLAVPCDVLVPAAIGGAIDGRRAVGVRAKMIVEGANYPCDADGEAVLRDRGIVVVPDILANSGGVIGSHLEVVLDLGGLSPAALRETYRNGIRERIKNGFEEVGALSVEHGIDLRGAALAIGLTRVLETHAVRGLYP